MEGSVSTPHVGVRGAQTLDSDTQQDRNVIQSSDLYVTYTCTQNKYG
jgi:hypothetical protein